MALQQNYLEFEKPLAELDKKIQELLAFSTGGVDLTAEVAKLEQKAEKMREDISHRGK